MEDNCKEFALDLLTKDKKAIIIDIKVENLPTRLIEMGSLVGSEIILKQKAPLGDPLYFIIDNSHICIRKDLAKEISVKIL